MFERLIITLVIAGGLALLWLGWQFYKAKLLRTIPPSQTPGDKPTLLYFMGDYCTICKVQQLPIVKEISDQFGSTITVQTHNVSANPELAGRYKVLTLPTTVILDSSGRAIDVNYGLAHQEKLEAQLSQAVNFNQSQVLANEFQHIA